MLLRQRPLRRAKGAQPHVVEGHDAEPRAHAGRQIHAQLAHRGQLPGEAEKTGYPYRYRSRCQPKSYRTLNLGKTDITGLFPLGKTDKDMIKRKIDSYLEHFFKQNKKALLLTGARQIGKTFSIRRLGHEHFEHFVEINFIESPNLVSVFSKAASGQGYLSSYLHDHVHPKGAATPDQLYNRFVGIAV